MTARSIVFCLVLILIKFSCQNSDVRTPNVTTTIRALYPKGFRAHISVDVETKFIMFDGILYDSQETAVDSGEVISNIWGIAAKQDDGFLFEDLDVTLNVGQAISYGIFVGDFTPEASPKDEDVRAFVKFEGVASEYKIFVITALEDPTPPGPNCLPTITKVRGRQVCAGQVIFEDNFDRLREDLWQVEQYIPIDHPEYPFVSYQRLKVDPNVFTDSGNLHIIPKCQEDLLRTRNESIVSGSLDLTNGCTRRKCSKVADGYDILPPIVSGRLTSNPFVFTYGTVYVRAKVPQGDWLYPEILLEPLFNKYGDQKDLSSILKIAMTGGNREISETVFGNKILRGPSIWNESCFTVYTPFRRLFRGYWSDDFHEYVLQWTPESIELSVDGDQYLRYQSPKGDKETTFRCSEKVKLSFHDYLHITLGVAVGGISEFPDSLTTGSDKPKPWRNHGNKASLQFWRDRESWFPTWTQPGLIVDYVKVVAL